MNENSKVEELIIPADLKIYEHDGPSKELDESLMQMIKRLEEERIILTHPPTDSRTTPRHFFLLFIKYNLYAKTDK